jgi:hypothetical protein
MNNNYGYLGASWAAGANAARTNAQNQQQMLQQYAPQQRQFGVQRQQLNNQKAVNSMSQRDRMLGFSVSALAGLMR